ncbi:helix-turn-helix domain-containing protein [Nonomuraea sp. NPDC050790]|uniref:helix-turn-helix domain-containing protein n=1 Tax=Nonomuraea sp. NPDC050790 TaxID=3364371 RepID=UPI003789DD6A
MTERSTTNTLSIRLREIRKRRLLSQRQLAELSGVSKSWIAAIEQGADVDVRLETVRKLAVALRVSTTQLLAEGDDSRKDPMPIVDLAPWEQTRLALLGQLPPPDDEPTVDGVLEALGEIVPLLADNLYRDIADRLPELLCDADALNGEGRTAQARVLNATGWLMVQMRQFDLAEVALSRAIDLANDRLDAAAAVNTQVWLHLRKGELDQGRALAIRWADDMEPRFSRASNAELCLWGRLLLGIANAGVRDNRPGEAEDALQLARAAAVRVGRETLSDTSTARTFGPVTVSMIAAESAVILDQPERALAIADRISARVPYANSASRNRHKLDTAAALVATRRHSEAWNVLSQLRHASPEWLRTQRYARDILRQIIARRRSLNEEIRSLADEMALTY